MCSLLPSISVNQSRIERQIVRSPFILVSFFNVSPTMLIANMRENSSDLNLRFSSSGGERTKEKNQRNNVYDFLDSLILAQIW